jgi:hypothetical protein
MWSMRHDPLDHMRRRGDPERIYQAQRAGVFPSARTSPDSMYRMKV